jgi:hypothetical protein
MTSTPSNDATKPAKIDIKKEIEHSEWKQDPLVGFEQRATLTIARWILTIFGGVYVLGFVGAFILLTWKDATFERGSELVKFLVQLPLPLVTLAVGYYLGDRNRQQTTRRR